MDDTSLQWHLRRILRYADSHDIPVEVISAQIALQTKPDICGGVYLPHELLEDFDCGAINKFDGVGEVINCCGATVGPLDLTPKALHKLEEDGMFIVWFNH